MQTKQIRNDEDNSIDDSCGDSGIDTTLQSYVHKTMYMFGSIQFGDYISTQRRQQHNSTAGIRCQHTFHTRCIKQWLLDRDDCPICRSSFGIGDDDVRRVLQVRSESDGRQDINI